jgi:sensor histidine kinase regulating citrate/malate metabolism
MKVRTRLVLSFSYVLLVVIVALTVPLAIVLRDRARSELESLALSNAQTIAAVLDSNGLEGRGRRLARDIERFADDVDGRVVVLDARGTVVADSDGEDLGQAFATAGRPEVRDALDSTATAGVRTSEDEGGDIVVAAAPIIDDGTLIGAVRISRDVEDVQRNVTRATLGIVVVAVAGLLAGLILAFVLARSLARPLGAGRARRWRRRGGTGR